MITSKRYMINIMKKCNYADTLTREEKRKGWRLLWDGKTTDGWRGSKSDHFPEHGIKIVNGTIHFLKHDKKKDFREKNIRKKG